MRKLRNILLLAATISLFTGFSAYAENYWWVNALGEWGYSANDGKDVYKRQAIWLKCLLLR